MGNIGDYFEPTEKQRLAAQYIGRGYTIFWGGARSGGKAQTLDSKVVTPFGFKRMGDIKVGSLVNNPDGSVSTVIQIHPQGEQDIYRVTFCDGAYTDVTDSHIWDIWTTGKLKQRNGKAIKNRKLMSTRMMIDFLNRKKGKTSHKLCVPLTEPVCYNIASKWEKLDPYLLGLLLGDGYISKEKISLHNNDPEILSYIENKAIEYGTIIRHDKGRENTIVFVQCDQIKKILSRDRLLDTKSATKFIPRVYLYAPIEERFELIQGLMDTDGYVDSRGHMSYTTVSEQLAKDFRELAMSLGAKANIVKDKAGYKGKDGEYIQCQDAYTVYFNSNWNDKFVRLQRKKERCKQYYGGHTLYRSIDSIEFIGRQEAQCITVNNPNGLYLTDDFIVTHNSAGCAYYAMLAAILFPGIWIMIIRKSYQEVMKNYFFKMRSIYPPKAFKYKPLKSDKYFDFSNGSKIFFMQCSNTDDADKIKGIECQLMIVDEANEIDETTLMMLFGSVRNSSIKDFIPTKIMTGNPGGESDQWFLDHFVEVDYSKWRPEEIKNKDKFVYIPATVYDNKHVNEEYIEYLKTLPTELREAWLNGNWHVTQGQFFSEWRDDIHVVPTFKVPDNWVRSFGFDAGYSKEHNSIGLWVAQNPDTEELFVYREYAGTITEQCVKDIIRLSEGEHFRQRVCDPAIFIEKKETYVTQSAGRMFMSAGFALTPANNKREIGWMLLKQWLHWSDYKKPMLYVMDCCPKTRLSIPAAKYKRSGKIADINDFVNDDPLDTLRYIIVSGGFSYPVTDLRGNRPKLEVEHKVETPYWAIKREERIRALKYNNSISKASYTRW